MKVSGEREKDKEREISSERLRVKRKNWKLSRGGGKGVRKRVKERGARGRKRV